MNITFILDASLAWGWSTPSPNHFIEVAHQEFILTKDAQKRRIYQHFFDYLSYIEGNIYFGSDQRNIYELLHHSLFLNTLGDLPSEDLRALRNTIALIHEDKMFYPYVKGMAQSYDFYGYLVYLIDRLSSLNDSSLSVIQTSYDLSFELACVNGNYPYHYGFQANQLGVPVLKLFGSLNWFEQGSQLIYPILLEENLQDLTEVTRFNGASMSKLSFLNSFDQLLPDHMSVKHIEREPLLYSEFSEAYQQPVLNRLWRNAFKSIQSSDYIIFIGGLDRHCQQRSLLLSAIAQNKKLIQMYVYEPAELARSSSDLFWSNHLLNNKVNISRFSRDRICHDIQSTFEWTGVFHDQKEPLDPVQPKKRVIGSIKNNQSTNRYI